MHEIITLSNGKRVANFSSPHPFTFTDGSVLPAVDNESSEHLKVIFHEEVLNEKGDVSLKFSLSDQVKIEMLLWYTKYEKKEVDVVFCALPMITAIAQEYGAEWLANTPFRGIRMEDRILKLISIDKQCLATDSCGVQA